LTILFQNNRCPGSLERAATDPTNSVPFRPTPPADPYQQPGGLDCDPTQVAGGVSE
jgi:hypothetical protein